MLGVALTLISATALGWGPVWGWEGFHGGVSSSPCNDVDPYEIRFKLLA